MHRTSCRLLAFLMSVLIVFSAAAPAFAANRFWVGENSDRWEDTNNWSTLPKGAGGGGVPGATDVAIFEGSGTTIQMRSAVSIQGLVLMPTWTGSVLQGTGTIQVGNSGVRAGSGRLVGGNAVFANSGSYTQTGGIVNGIMNTFSLSGSFTLNKGASSAEAAFTSTGTVLLSGNTDQTFTAGGETSTTFTNFEIKNTGGTTADDIIMAVNRGLSMSGNLTITLGNLDMSTNSTNQTSGAGTGALFVLGDITLADDAQATLTTNSNVTVSGSITVNDAATWTMTGGTLELNGTNDQTVDLDGQQFNNVIINNAGGGTRDEIIINGGGLNMSGKLLIAQGNLDMSTNSQVLVGRSGLTIADAAQATLTTDSNVTMSGDILVNNSATWGMTGGTLTLNDDSDQNVDLDGQSFFNLTINNTGGGSIDDIIFAGGDLNLSGSLTITQGFLDLFTNTLALRVDDSITLADDGQAGMSGRTIEVAGTFTKNDASTFNHSGGTVTLDGNTQTISGSINFYNLTKTVSTAATLNFGANQTITTYGALTLKGISGNALSLRSTTDGTQWKVLPNGTKPVEYLSVKDANNLHANAILCDIGCSDAGNNTNWKFTRGGTDKTTTTSSGGGGGGGRRTAPGRTAPDIDYATRQIVEEEQAVTPVVPQPGLPTVRDRLTMTVEGRSVVFRDVPVNEWFAPFVAKIIGRGIASGYKDARGSLTGVFGPANPVTFAEIAKMALETAGESIADVGGPPLNRTARRQWSQDYIRRAEDLELSVYTLSLDVNAPATRGAVVQTVLESLGVPLDSSVTDAYRDLHVRHPHARALSTATRLGIISGDTDRRGNLTGTVRPNDPINRAETTKILTNVLDLGL